MARVTKDTMIGDLLQIDQNVAPLLLNIGMHCLGCPSSQMETIEEAAMVHGLDRMILSLKSTHSSITTSVNLRKDGLLMQAVFYCNQYSVKVLPASGWQLLQ